MRTHKRQTRPMRVGFCLLLVSVLLCLTVFAAVPENGVNTPMFGDSHSAANSGAEDRGTAKNRSGDTGAANAVTDAADAVGDVVSDAGDAVSEVVGDIGHAAGEVVSDAGDAIGGAVNSADGSATGSANGSADGNNGAVTNGENSADGTVTGNQNSTADNRGDTAMPFDTHSAENAGNASTAGTVTKEDTPAGMSWILILILIAAAAAIFFLILMPKRSRDM